MGKAKIQVLEALLRLRQAACHPALIDAKRANEASAKMDVLLSQLREVTAEGHKALVFSQFTSFLKIVRGHLDDEGLVYEYLDGATRDRRAPVERFQNDPECKLFLISLKAGGLGLNLTAAGYVFLFGSLVEPGRGSAGGGSRAPHRPAPAGIRLSPDRPRYGGRERCWICKRANAI